MIANSCWTWRAPVTRALSAATDACIRCWTGPVKPVTIFILGLVSAWAPPAAADFAFVSTTGNFSVTSGAFEDFSFSLPITSNNLILRTLANAGGMNAAGDTVAAGGIDSTLALFNSASVQIAFNDDNAGLDSLISLAPQPAGDYRLRLANFGAIVGDGHWATDVVSGNANLTLTAISGNNSNLATLSLGSLGAFSATLAVGPAATMTVVSDLRVGVVGNGALNVTAGGSVTNTYGSIGYYSGSIGEATVSGTVNGLNSLWANTNELRVGVSGDGTLNVVAGGKVTNTGGIVGTEVGSTGQAMVAGSGSQWNNTEYLIIGGQGNGTLNVQAGGTVTSIAGYVGNLPNSTGVVTVTGTGSKWNTPVLYVGVSDNGTLNVQAGGKVNNDWGSIGYFSAAVGVVTVSGTGSQWNNSGNLVVGTYGTGILNIQDSGLVHVGAATSIGASACVNLTGGRFEFGQTSLTEFNRIYATGGSLAGIVNHTGYTNAATLTVLQNTAVDVHEVTLTNFGTLYGNSALGATLVNTATGEVETLAGERLRFAGAGSTNAGEINNLGGEIRFAQSLTNNAGALISGRGQFIANGGWSNSGVMALSGGLTDVYGDVNNLSGGKIVTSGAGLTTFYDDVVHNGSEIRTSAGSSTVFFGSVSGAGPFTGTGTVFFEGDLRPGNSPAAVSFGGNVVLAETATTTIELGGTTAGAYDQLLVSGHLTLGGVLDHSLVTGFQPHTGDFFASIYSAASVAGAFGNVTGTNLGGGLLLNPISTATSLSLLAALPGDANLDTAADFTDLGSLLNNYNNGGFVGIVQWNAGDFNDDHSVDFIDLGMLLNNYNQHAPLLAATAPVPEPSTLVLACFAVAGLAVRMFCERRNGRRLPAASITRFEGKRS